MPFVTAQTQFWIPRHRRDAATAAMLCPLAAAWSRAVPLGARRSQCLSLAHSSTRRELFHDGLACKRKLSTARQLPCHNSVRNGSGKESKGSDLPLRKPYHQSSQAVTAASSPPAYRASAPQHGRLPSDARDTSSSWGARPEQGVTRECKLSLMFSLSLPWH